MKITIPHRILQDSFADHFAKTILGILPPLSIGDWFRFGALREAINLALDGDEVDIPDDMFDMIVVALRGQRFEAKSTDAVNFMRPFAAACEAPEPVAVTFGASDRAALVAVLAELTTLRAMVDAASEDDAYEAQIRDEIESLESVPNTDDIQ